MYSSEEFQFTKYSGTDLFVSMFKFVNSFTSFHYWYLTFIKGFNRSSQYNS